jgi:hypothetical protein
MVFGKLPVLVVLSLGLAMPALPGNNGTSLKGSAHLDRNRPVVGASVRIRPENDRSRYLLTSTDGQGLLETMDLPDGDYQVSLTKDGLVPVTKSEVKVRFPFRTVVEIKMAPGPDPEASPADAGSRDPLELNGRILTRQGDPVADVTVRLVRLDGAGDPVKIQSAEDGTLAGSGLKGGSWAVEVQAAGYLSIRSVLELDGPVRLVALLIPQPAGYLAPALDLLPEEQPVPPSGLTPRP